MLPVTVIAYNEADAEKEARARAEEWFGTSVVVVDTNYVERVSHALGGDSAAYYEVTYYFRPAL